EGWLPAEQRDELRQRLAALPDHARHHVLGWSRAAANHDARLAWNMGTTGRVSLRRWSIAAAALELVDLVTFPDDGDDEVLPNEDRVRLALSLVMGDVALQPAFPVGALLGALTIDEADRLAAHRL